MLGQLAIESTGAKSPSRMITNSSWACIELLECWHHLGSFGKWRNIYEDLSSGLNTRGCHWREGSRVHRENYELVNHSISTYLRRFFSLLAMGLTEMGFGWLQTFDMFCQEMKWSAVLHGPGVLHRLCQAPSPEAPSGHFDQQTWLRFWVCTWSRNIMTGWWFEPLWKIWKSIGMIIPNIWENKIDVPNHQPVSIIPPPH